MTITTRSDVLRKLAKLNTHDGDCWTLTFSLNGYSLWFYDIDESQHHRYSEAGNELTAIANAVDELLAWRYFGRAA